MIDTYSLAGTIEVEIATAIGELESGKYRIEIVKILHKHLEELRKRVLEEAALACEREADACLQLYAPKGHHMADAIAIRALVAKP